MGVFNSQYMGATGDYSAAATVVYPPQASVRTTDTSAVDDPESPITIMRAAPNPNEIWRLNAGEIIKTFLFDVGAQLSAGELYIGKLLLGGLGKRWFHVSAFNGIATAANSIDVNSAQRLQQTFRVHPGEELIMALNDGGTAWDASQTQQVQIPFEVASGVGPAQMAASLRVWG